MTFGIIFCIICSLFFLLVVFVIVPNIVMLPKKGISSYDEKDESGIIYPVNSNTKKCIMFYSFVNGKLKINFLKHVSYAELMIVGKYGNDRKLKKIVAVSPDEDNVAEITFSDNCEEYFIVALRTNDNILMNDKTTQIVKKKQINLASFLLSFSIFLVSISALTLVFFCNYNIHNGGLIWAIGIVVTLFLCVILFNISKRILKDKYAFNLE